MSRDWMMDERHMLEAEWLDEIAESVHRRTHAQASQPDLTCPYCASDDARALHAALAQRGIVVSPATFMALGDAGHSLLAECLEILAHNPHVPS